MTQTVPETQAAPAAGASSTKMTFEQFLEWADEDTYAEWVNGEVIAMSPASDQHQDLSDFLTALLRHYTEAKGTGKVRSAPFVMKTGPDQPGREPDIVYVTRENTGRIKRNYLDGPADLVVEIISPESRARDRGDKYYEYEQGGVPEYWLIDPLRKQAEFYRRGEDGYYHSIPAGEDGIYRSAMLTGFWLKVEWLWQDPLPTLLSVLKEWGLV
jgi:Uma2 family endonuclease